MSRFLLDANLSPQTAEHLRAEGGLDAMHLSDLAPGSPTDLEVVAIAEAQERVIITLDNDFGEIYHAREGGKMGVIVLRVRDQTVESVNRVLFAFFAGPAEGIELDSSLVVVEPSTIRVVMRADS